MLLYALLAYHHRTVTAHSYALAIALAATIIGVPAATLVARESGREDPGFVVIDEVAGQALALAVVPYRWYYLAAAFVLFRLFDILKPPPVRQLERLPEGYGIMFDDLGAGCYASVVLLAVRHWHLL